MIASVLLGGASAAQAGRRIAVVAAGACPERETVVAALVQAMPDVSIVDPAADAPSDVEPVVVVSDGSASYRAVIRGVVRTMIDVPAQCEERARKVAIVAALAFEPPLIERAAPAPIEVMPARAAVRSSALGMRLEGGGMAERGWSDHTWLTPVGHTVRLTIEYDHLDLVIGGTLATKVELAAGFVQRIPIDVALQLRHRADWIAGAIEIGPSVVFQRTEVQDRNDIKSELDLRLSGRLEMWPSSTYGMFTAVTGTFIPSLASMSGGVAVMPRYWIGASAGLVIQLR